ncbi:4-amino-4-deoxychorismate lyase [gamma proteobacterium HTCC5015]|nr:4-amino-4-deoxychorismate lyase [gamma proteobacterium HTCC5015]
MASQPIAVLNRELIESVPITHRGLHYGDGVFETIAVDTSNACLLWEEHLARLERGARVLGLAFERDRIESDVQFALSCSASGQQRVLKLSLLRAGQQRGYTPGLNGQSDVLVSVSPWSTSQDDFRLVDGDVALSPQGVLQGLKTHNSLEYVIAARALVEKGAQEAVLCDDQGYMVEGTRSNLFWVNSTGTLSTSKLDRCGVTGVVREVLLKRAMEDGLPIKLSRATPDALAQSPEIFVTNSLLGVQSVTHYKERTLKQFNVAARVRDFMAGAILAH